MLDRVSRWIRGVDRPAAWGSDLIQTRAIDSVTDHPGLTEQLLAVQGLRAKPWTPIGIREALSVPAVWRAVTLLSNLAGSLLLEGYRNGTRLPRESTPGIVRRPDPFRTFRTFIRDTVWNLATRGEYIWYVGARDADGIAQALVNVPPAEVQVEWEDDRLGLRRYLWRDVEVPRSRIIHETFAQESGALRGVGPLQICGAALSAAAEADSWAASFYAGGGMPSVVIRSQVPIDAGEAQALRDIWVATAEPNMPRVTSLADVSTLGFDPKAAQLTEERLGNRGAVAVMYGIPGHLLEYAAGGSSLTYQNLGAVGDELVRFTLAPGYLAIIEQAISDLLTRTTTARFDVDGLLRADPKTRAEIYRMALGPTTPWITADEARQAEGLDPGGLEFAPVPPNVSTIDLPSGLTRQES